MCALNPPSDMSQTPDQTSGAAEATATPDRLARQTPMEEASRAPTPAALEYDYTNFYFGAGDDAFALLEPFDEW